MHCKHNVIQRICISFMSGEKENTFSYYKKHSLNYTYYLINVNKINDKNIVPKGISFELSDRIIIFFYQILLRIILIWLLQLHCRGFTEHTSLVDMKTGFKRPMYIAPFNKLTSGYCVKRTNKNNNRFTCCKSVAFLVPFATKITNKMTEEDSKMSV